MLTVRQSDLNLLIECITTARMEGDDQVLVLEKINATSDCEGLGQLFGVSFFVVKKSLSISFCFEGFEDYSQQSIFFDSKVILQC